MWYKYSGFPFRFILASAPLGRRRARAKTMDSASRNQVLLALSPDDLKLIAPHLTNTLLEQGKILFEQDQYMKHFYFPDDGMVSLISPLEDGRSIELAAVGRESVVGATLANGRGRAPMTAVVQVPGQGSRIAVAYFYAALNESASLRSMIGHHSEALFAQVARTVACNAAHSADARLCRWLLMVHDRVDGDTIQLTQEFLAQMLGVQRTTVTLVARSLQTAGLIKYRRGRIEILDRDGLEDAACGCYAINRRHFDRLMSLRPT